MQEEIYNELQYTIAELEKSNQNLEDENFSLKMKVKTLESFLYPVGPPVKPLEKNCGSNCSCRKTDTENL